MAHWALQPQNCNQIKSFDDHLQAMQLIQAPWQGTCHLPERRFMVQQILLFSQNFHKPVPNLKQAVLLAKHIEMALYTRAGSLLEYCNLATLRRRLQSFVASSMHEGAAREINCRAKRCHSDAPEGLQTKRHRLTDTKCSIFPRIGEDCICRIFSFLEGMEIMRQRRLNRFAAAFVPSCAFTLVIDVHHFTQALAGKSSMLLMSNLKQLSVQKALVPPVGSVTTPLYAWSCPDLPPNQQNDGEKAVYALAQALAAGSFPKLHNLQLLSVFVNTSSCNALHALCDALETKCCPLLNDLLLAGNCLADVGATEVARLLRSSQGSRLVRLDLRRNYIGEIGLRAILSALAHVSSQSLQVLCFGGNVITDNCVHELQQLLAGSMSSQLRFLGLEDNFLSVGGVQLVLETAAVNTTRRTTLWDS
ncbi:hypothetical protein CCR75_000150 [Bremia lactucae]|uniref:Uncharacterized protein n=1 Tax=Bremia lactucae TaxID=4779 RepID=A0A976IFC6_BRELC|nr:hypothetical protein CCR75_000150 [Bremia lactucae]